MISERQITGNADTLLKRDTLKLTASLYLLFLVYALSFTMLGPLLPVIRKQYGISLSQGGLITSFQGIGGSLSVLAGVLITDMLRRSVSIKITYTVYCLSVLLVAFLPYYYALLLLFFMIGASTRLTEAIINAYVSDIHSEKRGFYLNMLHACFGVGALLGPIFSTLFLYVNLNWSKVFVGLALICLLSLLTYMAVEKNIVSSNAVSERKKIGTVELSMIFKLLRNKNVLILCLFGLFYVGFVSGTSTWMPSYVKEEFNMHNFSASFPVAALWVGIIAGRIVYSFLSLKYKARSLVLYSNLVGGFVMIGAVLLNTYISFIIGLALVGFFIGCANPLAYTLLNEAFPDNRGSVSSALTFFGTLGLITIPWLIGVIAENAGFWYGLLVLCISPCGIAFASALLSPQKVNAQKT